LVRRARFWIDEPMARVALRASVQRPYRVRRFHSFGEHSILHKPDWVYGPSQISVGPFVLILHGMWLAVERQAWDLPAPVMRIGARVAIRPYCTISAAESIVIEDDVVIAAFTTLIDSDHTWRTGSASVLHNPLDTSPVRVGQGTWIGERVAVLRGANIGRFCLIGSNSVVRGSIPDHSVAVGAPARVVGQTQVGPEGVAETGMGGRVSGPGEVTQIGDGPSG
jgi:lipopolysaccharide O-acetyltransferase